MRHPKKLYVICMIMYSTVSFAQNWVGDFQLDGKVIAQHPLVVLDEVPEAGLFGRLWDAVWLTLTKWFGGWF